MPSGDLQINEIIRIIVSMRSLDYPPSPRAHTRGYQSTPAYTSVNPRIPGRGRCSTQRKSVAANDGTLTTKLVRPAVGLEGPHIALQIRAEIIFFFSEDLFGVT